MRKSLILFLMLLLCAVLVLTVTVTGVQQGSNQIVVTESTLAGDASAASDLQVRTLLNLERRMFWQTDYTVSDEPQAQTDYRFYQSAQRLDYESYIGDLDIRFASRDFGISGVVDFDEPKDYNRDVLMLPVKAVADQTAAGETNTQIVRLSDFYDCYPLVMDPIDHGVDGLTEVWEAHDAILQTSFPIPVPENEYMEVTVEKDAEGRVVDVNCTCSYENYETDQYGNYLYQPYLFSDSVVNEQWAYFLLRGNVDFSQLPNGYGLYRIPISWYEQWENYSFSPPQAHLELERMENVFPLDPACSETIRLEAGLDETELLLLEQTDTGTVLTVLDTGDFSVRQRLELGRETEPIVWKHDNLVILGYEIHDTAKGHLQILKRQNGQYSLWLDTKMYAMNDEGFYTAPVFAFDGTRFAMADFLEHYGKASHRIVVYGSDGLLYAGDYTYNCDTLPEHPVNYNWEIPLQISWPSH